MDVASSTTFIVSQSTALAVGVLAIFSVTVAFGFAVWLIIQGIARLRLAVDPYNPNTGDWWLTEPFENGKRYYSRRISEGDDNIDIYMDMSGRKANPYE